MNKNVINDSKMAEYYLIFGRMVLNISHKVLEGTSAKCSLSRSKTLPSNHHFFALLTIQLRLRRLAIRLDDKSRSRTLLRRYLLISLNIFLKLFSTFVC